MFLCILLYLVFPTLLHCYITSKPSEAIPKNISVNVFFLTL